MRPIDDLIAARCPNGVTHEEIGAVADCYAGATPASQVAAYWKGGTIPWMSSGEVNKGTIFETDKKITQAGYDSCSTRMVPPNAVVVALAGQGKTRGTVARTRISLCTNQSLCSIVTGERLNSDFLFHFLRTQYRQLRSVSTGDGARGGLNLQLIKGYRIPVPPLDVQSEIVKVLEIFTKLEAELGTELEARGRQYGYYRDLLMTFGARADVQWTTMGEAGVFIRGRRFTKDDVVSEGIGSIHYGEIYTQYGAWAAKTVSRVRSELAPSLRFARTGDVVIAAVGETVEEVCKAVAWLGDEEVAVHDDCFIFRHSMNPKFVSYYLQTRAFHAEKAKYVARAKVKRVSAEGLARLRIPVPPLAEQERIVSILDKFDALVSDPSIGLPAELNARRQQYEYYRDRLLTFPEAA
jgi:type I restriction enzyme, S subunit